MKRMSKYWCGAKDEFSNREAKSVVGWVNAYRYIESCNKILDCGCGVGNITEYCVERGHEAVGITYNPLEVKHANDMGRKYIMFADMQQLPFEDSAFDACISFDSLEHCPSMLDALSEIRRVLKPEGIAVIFIPGESWIECDYHIIVPTIRQMKHLLRLVNLELTKCVEYDKTVWSAEQALYVVRKVD